ncbi:MAG: hypothetical protein PVF15_01455 [Candidatus Bathyarchaeota archaeon]
MLEWLKELLTIYTWKELWILMCVPTSVVGVWLLFCFLITIPNDVVRTAAIWSLLLALTWGAATVQALRKQQS